MSTQDWIIFYLLLAACFAGVFIVVGIVAGLQARRDRKTWEEIFKRHDVYKRKENDGK